MYSRNSPPTKRLKIDKPEFDDDAYPYCKKISDKYVKIDKIGQGTYGEVHKALNYKTNEFVALKRILTDNATNGFPITAIREINILKHIKLENVANLIEMCSGIAKNKKNKPKTYFYMVFDFCKHDLDGLLTNPQIRLTSSAIKNIAKQLLDGVFYLHVSNIMHRDLKQANILVTKTGVIKITDFGLSRTMTQKRNYSNEVVTLWYRAPELLLGDKNYGLAVDQWSVGCILGEMWTRTPLFPSSSEQNQLKLITNLCGLIRKTIWPGVEKLVLFGQLRSPNNILRMVKKRLKYWVQDEIGLDLMDKLLTLDSSRRIDAKSALNHNFFWTDPMPGGLDKVLANVGMSNFQLTSLQNVQRKAGHVQSRAGHVQSRPGLVQSRAGHVQSRPGHVQSRAGNVQSKAEPVQSKAEHVPIDSMHDRVY